MKRNRLLHSAFLIAIFTGASFAADEPRGPALFKNLDRNGDGKLVADEVPAEKRVFYERLLRTSDKDGDGIITNEEFAEGFAKRDRASRAGRQDGPRNRQRRRAGQNRPGGPRGAERFKQLDRNGDGKVTREEMPERGRARFDQMIARLDKNGDGALSGEEFAALRGPGAPARNAAGRSRGQAGPFFALLDVDGDGKLTKAELKKAPRLLGSLDTDGDQALSTREIAAASRTAVGEGKEKPKKNRKKGQKGEAKKRKKNAQKKAKKTESDAAPKVGRL